MRFLLQHYRIKVLESFFHQIFNTYQLINLFFQPFKQFRTKRSNICRYSQHSLKTTKPFNINNCTNTTDKFCCAFHRNYKALFHNIDHLVSNYLFHNQKNMCLFPHNKHSMNQKNIVNCLVKTDLSTVKSYSKGHQV